MPEIFKWGKKLYVILADGKVTKAELPAFLEALAGLVMAIVVVVGPLLKGSAGNILKRLGGGLSLAAAVARK